MAVARNAPNVASNCRINASPTPTAAGAAQSIRIATDFPPPPPALPATSQPTNVSAYAGKHAMLMPTAEVSVSTVRANPHRKFAELRRTTAARCAQTTLSAPVRHARCATLSTAGAQHHAVGGATTRHTAVQRVKSAGMAFALVLRQRRILPRQSQQHFSRQRHSRQLQNRQRHSRQRQSRQRQRQQHLSLPR